MALCSKVWVCGHLLPEIVGSNSARTWMSVASECCVLSDKGLWDRLITCPEEFY